MIYQECQLTRKKYKGGSLSTLVSVITRKSIHAEVVKWMLAQPDHQAIDIINTPKPLVHARNLQVERFLSSPYDRIFLLDSDCVPPLNAVPVLEALDLPFVTVPHPTIQGNECGVMVLDKTEDGYKQHKPWDRGLQECDAVGCAGMMIHRSVFEKIEQPYFMFIYNKQGQLVNGEDFNFCEKIKEVGIKVYAYCDMVQRHYVEVAV